MKSLSLPILILIFLLSALIVWAAGTQLSKTTDKLSDRFQFGEALGGLIFLAITTNLPELAITASAGLTNNLGLAIGNILGGISIQTVVLVFLDTFGLGGRDPLSYMAASLELVLEGVLVIAVLVVAIMGAQLPQWLVFARVSPASVAIALLWVVGLWLINRARKGGLPWQDKGHAPASVGSEKMKKGDEEDEEQEDKDRKQQNKNKSTARTILIFVVASAVTLVAGSALEISGDAIANHIGLSGVLFGATFLAAATALPEVSTGFASVKLRDYEMAMSDIFGGNAFLPVLFLLANLLSGSSVLPQAQRTDIYLASLGCLLTAVYLYGLIFRPQRQLFKRVGIDSLVVFILYILGIVGLVAIAHG